MTADAVRWLALYLPLLPLELVTRGLTEPLPVAISQTGRRERILCCNLAAARQGVSAGLGVGAARALCQSLRLLPHRAEAEQEALRQIAAWCLDFTPRVSLSPPRALLLDVAASLGLFGGARSLVAQAMEGLSGLGYQGHGALAPTPLAALVLAMEVTEQPPDQPPGQPPGQPQDPHRHPARAGGGPVPAEPVPMIAQAALADTLARLPLRVLGLSPLGWSARELDLLASLGLRTLGEVLGLPRDGLARRLGQARVAQLERLLGERPDPRAPFEPPPRYSGRLALAQPVNSSEGLLFPCRRLLLELAGFLRGRQAGCQRLEWRLLHGFGSGSAFTTGAAQPQWEPERWLTLLRERLTRLELPAPVQEVRLRAGDLQPLAIGTLPLFSDESPGGGAPDAGLLDRLAARLGRDALRGLALVADHRPERSWRWCRPGEVSEGLARADRPLWLLPRPRRLETRAGRPWLDGELDLGNERERIDIGWWDGFEVRRDYFVATTRQGRRLWVYRELDAPHGWFLHGVFD